MTKFQEVGLEYAEALEAWAESIDALMEERQAIAERFCARVDALPELAVEDLERMRKLVDSAHGVAR